MYTTDQSLIDDSRLQISDKEVKFVVEKREEKEEYTMPSNDYADQLQIQTYGNSHGQKR